MNRFKFYNLLNWLTPTNKWNDMEQEKILKIFIGST